MVPSWIILSLLAATGWTIGVLLKKFIVDEDLRHAATSGNLHAFFNCATITVIAAFFGGTAWNQSVAIDGFILASLYVAANYFWFKGVGKEDVSRFAPVLSLDVAFITVLSAVFLGEQHSLVVYGAVVITVLGCLLISLEKPVSSLFKLQSRVGFFAATTSAGIYAVREIFFKQAVSTASTWSTLFYFGLAGIALSAVMTGTEWKAFDNPLREIELVAASGGISGVALTLFYLAVSSGPVSLVTTITKLRFVLIFIGATLLTKVHPGILHEPLKTTVLTQKLIATAMITSGAILVAII